MLGGVAGGVSLKRMWLVVILLLVGFISATVVLQSLGLAPAMKIA